MTLRERFLRLLIGPSAAVASPGRLTAADCPLPDCSTCRPADPPLADAGSTGDEVGLVFWWLIDTMPDVWQDRSFARRLEVAERVAGLRARARSERRVAL